MDNDLTIRDCTDQAGNSDAEKFNAYRKQRDSFFDEIEEDDEIEPKRRKFTPRFNEGLILIHPLTLIGTSVTSHFSLFRRRFRMPHESYKNLVN